jgi:SAM-dependent methyltransferase
MTDTGTSLLAAVRDGRSARRVLLDAALEELAPLMRGRVLEVGGGRRGRRGTFRPPSHPDAWLYVDVNVQAVPHVGADVMSLPFGDQTFDTVICLEVLEYVPSPEAALAEMSRVLRKGGGLILSAPFNTRPDTVTDFWRFTAPGLRHLATSAGLEVTRVREQGAAVSALLHMCRSLNRGSTWRRRLVAWITTPAFRMLLRWDESHSTAVSAIGGYTTGYVLVARKSSEGGR